MRLYITSGDNLIVSVIIDIGWKGLKEDGYYMSTNAIRDRGIKDEPRTRLFISLSLALSLSLSLSLSLCVCVCVVKGRRRPFAGVYRCMTTE